MWWDCWLTSAEIQGCWFICWVVLMNFWSVRFIFRIISIFWCVIQHWLCTFGVHCSSFEVHFISFFSFTGFFRFLVRKTIFFIWWRCRVHYCWFLTQVEVIFTMLFTSHLPICPQPTWLLHWLDTVGTISIQVQSRWFSIGCWALPFLISGHHWFIWPILVLMFGFLSWIIFSLCSTEVFQLHRGVCCPILSGQVLFCLFLEHFFLGFISSSWARSAFIRCVALSPIILPHTSCWFFWTHRIVFSCLRSKW